ncbi:MAG: two-component system sensor histidine kinase CreC [Verrucomicrobia bacterium]|nr:two-component system sensor histidine kinase CreC [Verrucomicrobiota bacterium]
MAIRTRIFLVYLLLVGGGAWYLIAWAMNSVRPRYLESMEESLVDSANLFASTVEADAITDGLIKPDALRRLFDPAYHRSLNARIYSLSKTDIDLRIYVTDTTGRVIYDSNHGVDEGKDYSQWRDVRLTLAGEYGARGSRAEVNNDASLVIHVAAPIHAEGRIIGSLTLGKPTRYINELVAVSRRRIFWAGLVGGILVVFTGFAFSVWLTTPIERLTAYARAVRDGKPATLPRLAGREVTTLQTAFDEMRDALEGKKYVERYTQTLTHEIKAPLSAIRGAAELLEEQTMPPDQRAKFLANIQRESVRIQQLIDKLLQLSALEARKGLGPTEPVELSALARTVIDSLAGTLHARRLTLDLRAPTPITLQGERFLLHQALANLLQNAAEFSPIGATVVVTLTKHAHQAVIEIEDNGPGLPDYAQAKVFERFYSLPRPDTGAKGTGLGLSFVREIAHLHHGEITLENRPERGCKATLILPA